ncbi:hypothetical protein QEN19_002189 [Hanseniaspora menglaensis]
MFQKKRINKLKIDNSSISLNTKNDAQKRKLELSFEHTKGTERVDNTKDNDNEESINEKEKIIYMDYEPLLCKEYKLKGYCGYGDTCKFIHSRDDYINDRKLVRKHWKKNLEKTEIDNNEKTESILPTDECFICKKDFKNIPDQKFVQLQCDHVFCTSCEINFLKKGDTKCAKCGKESKGIMKPYKF